MSAPLTTRRFTVDEYHRMAEAGILGEDDRVELLHGEIVPMTPIGVPHAGCVKRLIQLFSPLVARHAVTLAVQDPLVLAEYDEPQPDVAVLRYRADGYATRHPGPADTLLVIEVADTSIERDRGDKVPLYAAAGIPEAWLVVLPDDAIEVYTEPGPAGFGTLQRLSRGGTLRPGMLPDIEIAADEILG